MTQTASAPPRSTFRHEALLYRGEQDFLDTAVPFLQGAVDAGEAALVVVGADRISALKERLPDAPVMFADMADVGANPARIIPAWTQFVAEHGTPARGIGEPIWPGRPSLELEECQLHESLLNVAFAEANGFWLLCPYDIDALGQDVVDGAMASHPVAMSEGTSWESAAYREYDETSSPAKRLPPPPVPPARFRLYPGRLSELRTFVSEQAIRHLVDPERADDLVVAVNELAVNTLLYGGGHAQVACWREPHGLVLEVSDHGSLRDPLAGRRQPMPDNENGRGLWMVQQLCDLVQVRRTDAGMAVRVHLMH